MWPWTFKICKTKNIWTKFLHTLISEKIVKMYFSRFRNRFKCNFMWGRAASAGRPLFIRARCDGDSVRIGFVSQFPEKMSRFWNHWVDIRTHNIIILHTILKCCFFPLYCKIVSGFTQVPTGKDRLDVTESGRDCADWNQTRAEQANAVCQRPTQIPTRGEK